MDILAKITDLRLKAHLKGLADNQTELRRLAVKVAKSQKVLKDPAFKPKSNTFDREATVAYNNFTLRETQRERHYVRLEARAAHLVKMMFRGVPYMKVEQVVKPQTPDAELIMFEYFPGVAGKVTVDLLDRIRLWLTEPVEVAK